MHQFTLFDLDQVEKDKGLTFQWLPTLVMRDDRLKCVVRASKAVWNHFMFNDSTNPLHVHWLKTLELGPKKHRYRCKAPKIILLPRHYWEPYSTKSTTRAFLSHSEEKQILCKLIREQQAPRSAGPWGQDTGCEELGRLQEGLIFMRNKTSLNKLELRHKSITLHRNTNKSCFSGS